MSAPTLHPALTRRAELLALLAEITAARAQLYDQEHAVVTELRQLQTSWRAIGAALGLAHSAAMNRWSTGLRAAAGERVVRRPAWDRRHSASTRVDVPRPSSSTEQRRARVNGL